jgi:hypothetical protein
VAAGEAVAVEGNETGSAVAVGGEEPETTNAGEVGSAVSAVAAHSGHNPLGDRTASGLEHRVQEVGDGTAKPSE